MRTTLIGKVWMKWKRCHSILHVVVREQRDCHLPSVSTSRQRSRDGPVMLLVGVIRPGVPGVRLRVCVPAHDCRPGDARLRGACVQWPAFATWLAGEGTARVRLHHARARFTGAAVQMRRGCGCGGLAAVGCVIGLQGVRRVPGGLDG